MINKNIIDDIFEIDRELIKYVNSRTSANDTLTMLKFQDLFLLHAHVLTLMKKVK